MKILACLVALSCLTSAALAEEAANLLSNPNFAEWNGEKPEAWAVSSNQKLSPVTDAAADGVATALKVDVTTDGGETLGEIRQSVKNVASGRYRLEGMFQSTKPGLCVFMIKLRNGKEELKRLSTKDKSSEQWTIASLEFETEAASEIQVLCRYDQSSKSVGGSGAFTKLKLVKLD